MSFSLFRSSRDFSRVARHGWTRSMATMSIHEPTSKLPYDKLASKLQTVRQARGNQPLSLAEKIIYSHLDNPQDAKEVVRGKSYLKLRPGKKTHTHRTEWTTSTSAATAATSDTRICTFSEHIH